MQTEQKRKCKSCGHEMIFLINPKSGKPVPVDAETVEAGEEHYRGKNPDGTRHHISHFETCTTPSKFSRK